MTVIKVTKSGKALLVVTDDGTVYSTSLVALRNLLAGNMKPAFLLLSRMPFKAEGRFEPSPLFTPVGYVPPKEGETVMDSSYKKRAEQEKAYQQDVTL